jgi:hypothetical protein
MAKVIFKNSYTLAVSLEAQARQEVSEYHDMPNGVIFIL